MTLSAAGDRKTITPYRFRTPWHIRFLRLFRHYEHLHLPCGATLFVLSLAVSWGSEVWHLFEWLFWPLAIAYLGCWGYLYVARIYERYPNRLRRGLKEFLEMPEQVDTPAGGMHFHYRYIRRSALDVERRPIPNAEDIAAFVRLSEDSPTIVAEHPELDWNSRLSLYERWYKWSPRSFALLEAQPAVPESQQNKNIAQAIAVSIILPLSRPGKNRLINGECRVLDLTESDLQKKGKHFRYLLIDTWIIRRDYQRLPYRQGHTLLMAHLAAFWNPTDQKRVTIFVEPAKTSMNGFLQRAAFDGPHPIAFHSRVYFLDLPKDLVTREMKQVYSELTERVGRLGAVLEPERSNRALHHVRGAIMSGRG